MESLVLCPRNYAKFSAWVESSVRRVVLHLPISTAFANEWVRIARTIGVVPT